MDPEQHPPIIELDQESELTEHSPEPTQKRSRKLRWFLYFLGTKVVSLALVYFYIVHLNSAPADFRPQTITIEAGQSATEIAATLAAAGIVRSSELLRGVLFYFEDPTKIKAATYTFTEPLTTTEVAETLVQGEFDNALERLTFVEGMRIRDYAEVAATLPEVRVEEFLAAAEGLEGQLFPETYFVPEYFTASELVSLMHNSHLATMDELLSTASTSLSTDYIITLASIVEREANTPESMRLVAGIFQNRLAIGMPLQADASIEYVIDTPLGELAPGQLAAELRELDSPYNTYLYNGLPPTPIGNPGRVALAAVIDPQPSDYFYYITGNDGEFYYAETYDQHLVNIARHLR